MLKKRVFYLCCLFLLLQIVVFFFPSFMFAQDLLTMIKQDLDQIAHFTTKNPKEKYKVIVYIVNNQFTHGFAAEVVREEIQK